VFDALAKDAARRRFDMVKAWSVDRLGLSLQDLVGFLYDLHAYGIDLFLQQQGLDTTTPAASTDISAQTLAAPACRQPSPQVTAAGSSARRGIASQSHRKAPGAHIQGSHRAAWLLASAFPRS